MSLSNDNSGNRPSLLVQVVNHDWFTKHRNQTSWTEGFPVKVSPSTILSSNSFSTFFTVGRIELAKDVDAILASLFGLRLALLKVRTRINPVVSSGILFWDFGNR